MSSGQTAHGGLLPNAAPPRGLLPTGYALPMLQQQQYAQAPAGGMQMGQMGLPAGMMALPGGMMQMPAAAAMDPLMDGVNGGGMMDMQHLLGGGGGGGGGGPGSAHSGDSGEAEGGRSGGGGGGRNKTVKQQEANKVAQQRYRCGAVRYGTAHGVPACLHNLYGEGGSVCQLSPLPHTDCRLLRSLGVGAVLRWRCSGRPQGAQEGQVPRDGGHHRPAAQAAAGDAGPADAQPNARGARPPHRSPCARSLLPPTRHLLLELYVCVFACMCVCT